MTTENLESLRWRADQLVTNHFGERVWLRHSIDRDNKINGITECCEQATPCEHHRALAGKSLDDMNADELRQRIDDLQLLLDEATMRVDGYSAMCAEESTRANAAESETWRCYLVLREFTRPASMSQMAERVEKAAALVALLDKPPIKCRCTYEQGDTRCFVHPRCNYCGEETKEPVDECDRCLDANRRTKRVECDVRSVGSQ